MNKRVGLEALIITCYNMLYEVKSMNINIYLEDTLAQSLNYFVKETGQSRNAIIREAVKEYIIAHQEQKWPDSVLKYKGTKGITPFESHRDDLLPPKEDPFK
jgi:hypothetical protein